LTEPQSEAGRRADTALRDFIAAMARAGNPGVGRHEVGMHHVDGWILDYDPTQGGAEIQAVVGTDGAVHARREPRALRVRKCTAAEYVLGDDQGDPTARVDAFVARMQHLLTFDRDAEHPWGPPLGE